MDKFFPICTFECTTLSDEVWYDAPRQRSQGTKEVRHAGTLLSPGGETAALAALEGSAGSGAPALRRDAAAALAALRAEKLSALFFALAMAGSLGYYITDAALLGGLWSRAAFVRRIGRMDALLWGCLLGGVLGLFLL